MGLRARARCIFILIKKVIRIAKFTLDYL